jgi:hypothetical protein
VGAGVVNLHRAKGAGPDVQGDGGDLVSGGPDGFEQARREVQAGGRRAASM